MLTGIRIVPLPAAYPDSPEISDGVSGSFMQDCMPECTAQPGSSRAVGSLIPVMVRPAAFLPVRKSPGPACRLEPSKEVRSCRFA